MSENNNTPRRRRSDQRSGVNAQKDTKNIPLRAGFPPDDTAPMPLGGYDAARPAANPGRPEVQPNYRSAPRVYEDDSYLPPRRDPREYDVLPYDGEYDDDDAPRRRWPLALLALLLVVAIAFAASYFFLEGTTGILGQAHSISAKAVNGALNLLGLAPKEAPSLIKFETPDDTVQVGVKTVFTFTASQSIEDVRILDEVGTEIPGIREAVDKPANTTWTLTAILDKPMEGKLTAYIKYNNQWVKTDKTLDLTVEEPGMAPDLLPTALFIPEPTPFSTPVPTEAPTMAPALVEPTALSEVRTTFLTAVPTAVPTNAPTPAPTINPTAEPQTMQVQEPTAESQVPQNTELAMFSTAAPQEAAVQPDMTAVPISQLLPVFSAVPLTLPSPTPTAQETLPLDLPDELSAETVPEGLQGAFTETLPDEQIPDELNEEPVMEAIAEEAPLETPPALPPASPTPMPSLLAQASESSSPVKFGITEAAYQGNKKMANFNREVPIQIQGDGQYTYYEGGVFTFRGDGFRQNAAFGTVEMPREELSVLWKTGLGSLRTESGSLYGLGWTGQPAIIKWSIEVRAMMNLNEEKKAVKALKEVIFAAQDGKVYFLDLNDGLPTREVIDVGFPLKGSVAVDAIGQPMIAFGQGISKLAGKTGDIGYYIYNLVDQSKLSFINGRKTKSQLQYATNGAFDGTGLFDRFSDSLIIAGENGLLYTVKLNTVFDFKNTKTITIDPEITYLRGKGKQDDTSVSVESSVAMYGPYAFTADKQGFIRCIDTTTMKTVWMFDAGDNTDATIALEFDGNDQLALYTGTTVFTRTRKSGTAYIRRLDALTGEEVWSYEISAKYDAEERAGVKASPIVGQNEMEGLVVFTVNMTKDGGTILALNKETGEVAWSVALPGGAISSPVAVYDQAGRARVIQGSLDGKLYMIDGLSGQILNTLDLGGTIEGSPAVYNDTLVVGTSDKNNNFMYGIRIE